MHIRHVLAFFHGRLPARRLVALHLFGHALIGDGDRAHAGPYRVAIGMIAMVMRIENELHRLGRDFLGVRHRQPRPAREIGVHDDQVALHLDDDVVAVLLVHEIALAEPHARRDLFHRVRLRIPARDHKSRREQSRKASQHPNSLAPHMLVILPHYNDRFSVSSIFNSSISR